MTPLPCDTQSPVVTVTDAVAFVFVPRMIVTRSPAASPEIWPPSTVQAYVAPGTATTAAVAVPDLHAVAGTCTATAGEHSAFRWRAARNAMRANTRMDFLPGMLSTIEQSVHRICADLGYVISHTLRRDGAPPLCEDTRDEIPFRSRRPQCAPS